MRRGAGPQLLHVVLPWHSLIVFCHDYIALGLPGKRRQLQGEEWLNGWQLGGFLARASQDKGGRARQVDQGAGPLSKNANACLSAGWLFRSGVM